MHKPTRIALLALFLLLCSLPAVSQGYPWRDHAFPWDFTFGNNIDSHQQSKLSGRDQLVGFFYIEYTGGIAKGLPLARHCDGPAGGDCLVGWQLHGSPLTGTYTGGTLNRHPEWCVDAADLPRQPGLTHFHWLGAPQSGMNLAAGQSYDGFLLKLTANRAFCFLHGTNEPTQCVPVYPGIDVESHFNIVTDCN